MEKESNGTFNLVLHEGERRHERVQVPRLALLRTRLLSFRVY
jgi:hypothetical protein